MKWLDDLCGWFQSGWDSIFDWIIELFNSLGTGFGTFIDEWLVSQGLVLEIPSGVFKVLNEITLGIGYILPVSALMPILYFWLSFHIGHAVFSVFRLIHSTLVKRVSVKV